MPSRPMRTALAVAVSTCLLAVPVLALLAAMAVLADLTVVVVTSPPVARDAVDVLLGLATAGLAAALAWAAAAVAAGIHEAWAAGGHPDRAGSGPRGPGRRTSPSRPPVRPGRLVQAAVAGLVAAALSAPVAGAAERTAAPTASAPADPVVEATDPAPVDPAGDPAPVDPGGDPTAEAAVTGAGRVPGSWSDLAGTGFRAPATVAPASAALVTGVPSRQPAEPRQVVVVAGDSLWSLAQDHLGPGAGDAEVAAAWPTWWRANRATIGEDPDLIRPGQLLTVPTSTVVEEMP